ncbi:hypothetical protein Tco_1398559 [Tanacetum coccineum]
MGKKQDGTSHTMLKSILKHPSYGVNVKPASVGIEVGVSFNDSGSVDRIKRVDTTHDASVGQSCFATATVGSSFASKFHLESIKEDAPIVNKRVNFRTPINEESVANHDTVLPKAAKECVMSRYDNTLVGYFVVIERGLWLIRNTPLILNKWAPNVLLKPGEGRINFARSLIEIHANSELKKEVRMAILIDKDDGTGYTSKVIRVEYEWKPPHCLECKLFGHNSYKYPKQVSVVDPIIDTSANDGFTEVVRAVVEESVPTNDVGTTHIEGDTQNPESGMKNDGNEHVSSGSSKADDDKIQEEESLWSRGGFSLEDDDLNCYDGYDAQNTTHMMNALKEARIESREMLLSIHHSLKMLLKIISKMKRKLEDEKIKRNDKGKEKFNDL